MKVTVDGQESYVTASYKNGLKAKQTVILTTQSAWKATAGGHAVKAEADYRYKLTDELTKENNILGKKFNVAERMTTETILLSQEAMTSLLQRLPSTRKPLILAMKYASLRRLSMQVIETYQQVQSSVFSSRLMVIPVLSHGTISTMAV